MNKILDAIFSVCKLNNKNIAIIDDNNSYSWNKLLNYSYSIAHKLKSLNINKNDVVSIELPNSFEFMASILAIEMLGAIYVPLGNLIPPERLKSIYLDANVKANINEEFISSLNFKNNQPFKPKEKHDNEVEMIIYTSGSSGKPKGVVHTVDSLYHAVVGMHNKHTNPIDNDRFAIIAPLNFILGIQGSLGVLSAPVKNMTLVLMDIRKLSSPSYFINFLNKHHVNKIALGSSLLPLLKNNKTCVKKAFFGGDYSLDAYIKNIKTYNSYGATELGGGVFFYPINKNFQNPPIGEIFPHLNYYILDEANKETNKGELCISGIIAKEYLNLKKESNKSFILNPFYKLDGHKFMFKTGDIVEKQKDSSVIMVGRKDYMVKINGQRVELPEIEKTIRRILDIKNVVVRYFNQYGPGYLVCYYQSDFLIDKEFITNELKKSLSGYMIPQHYIKMDRFPLLSSGKINRLALPSIDLNSSTSEYEEPKTKQEKIVCGAFKNIFNLKQIGVNDDFIALGGESLSAIKLVSYLKTFSLTATDIFQLRTPKLIAKKIESLPTTRFNLNKYTIKTGSPLSEQQLNVYLDIVLNKKTNAYLIPLEIDFSKFTVNHLVNSLNHLIDAHPILKCKVDDRHGHPYLVLGDTPLIDVKNELATSYLHDFLNRPFNLGESLSRFLIDKKHKKLYAVFHHIIFDGTSVVVFARNLFNLLNKGIVSKDETFLKASEFYNEVKNSSIYKEAASFYEKELGGLKNLSELLPDIGKQKSSINRLLLNVGNKEINQFVQRHHITSNILFTSVFAYTLSRFSNSNESYFNLVENGREYLDPDFKSIGMYVNTLPIVIDCKNDTIDNFIKNSKDKILNTYKYSFYSYRELKNRFGLNSSIQFQYLPNIKLENVKVFEKEQRKDLICDLSIDLYQKDDGYLLQITTSNKYSSETAKRMLLTYETILKEMLIKDKLCDINCVSKNDIELINRINNTERKIVYKDILEAFNHSVKTYPNNLLVSYLDTKYTYIEGIKWINNLDKKLNGVVRGSNIAIFTHRSHFYLLTALAVLNRGFAYVPIDDTYPDDRIKFMLKDSGAKLILVSDETINRVRKLTNIPVINVSDIKPSGSLKPLNTDFKEDDKAVILYTSGTTGIPKGTILPRKAILSFSDWCSNETKLNSRDSFAMYSSYGFDVHIETLFAPIYVGAKVAVVPTEHRTDLVKLVDYLEKENVTHIELSTAFTKLLFTYRIPKTLKLLFTGGEALGDFKAKTHCSFYDTYGPTEATVSVSYIKIKDKIDPSSIGYLTSNTKGYILDKEHRLVPYGAIGELYLSGYQLAIGYLNRDKENAAAFFNNPFSREKGYERMYKTGDIVRYLPDGTLGFIGRTDSQVKIRGNRVELGEVEATIRQIKEIKDVTVQTISNDNVKELVAYVVSADKEIKERITKYVEEHKPAYMIPSHVVILDKIPLNANGKVDKNALSKISISSIKAKYVAPTNEVEKAICKGFATIFNTERVGIYDDFLDLGGDSLDAIRLLSVLKNYSLTAADVTNLRTPKLLAEKANTFSVAGLNLNQYSLETGAPLSEQQLNIYLDIVMNKKVESYLIPFYMKLDKYSSNDVKSAINKLFDIHPILKGYISNHKDIPFIKVGNKPIVTITNNINKDEIIQFFESSFDIHKELSRFLYDQEHHILYAVFHHLIFDGLSSSIISKHLIDILNKNSISQDLIFLKASAFSREIKKTNIFKEAELFYEKEFCESENIVELIPDCGTNLPSYEYLKLKVDQSKINQFINKHQITKNVLFTSVFAYTLSRFANSDDSYFTFIENGRDRLNAIEAVGMFVNTLPILIDCRSDSVANFIKKSKERMYQSINYNFYPFRLLNKKYGVTNNINFQYQPDISDNQDNNFAYPDNLKNRSDLISDLSFVATDDSISVTSSKKYSSLTIKKILRVYERIVNEILDANDLKDINYLLDEDKLHIKKINETHRSLKYKDILEGFNTSLKKYSNNTLVTYSKNKYTYLESSKWINNLTSKLKNIPHRSNVAVLVSRSHYYVLTALAVLNHGSTYVPIDDIYPDDRIKFILKDCSAKMVLVNNETIDRVKKLTNIDVINVDDIKYSGTSKPLNLNVKNDASALILYTSGTTGEPKGSIITRLALLNVCENYINQTHLNNNDIYSMYCSTAFDIHTVAYFAPMMVGGTTDIVPQECRFDLNKLNNHFNKVKTTHTFLTTQVGKVYAHMNYKSNLKILFVGGEYLGEYKFDNNFKMVDIYGPTESLVYVSSIDVDKKIDSSSIGRPNSNVRTYILDKELRQVPFGAMGELYLSGYQLAKGYLNRDKENKDAYFVNPFTDEKGYERMYRTGDIVRYLPDDTLGFISRRDSQVKIRGNRVELGEVETAIRKIKEVDDVTVQAISNNNIKELVAYVVSKQPLIEEKIVNYIKLNKPAHMVPTHIIVINKIPLNANGKVNKRALPKVDITSYAVKYVAPTNKIESDICDAFKMIFNLNKIGINDDFISLGGDSLGAIRLLSALKDYSLTANDITSLRTPKALAEKLNRSNLNLNLNKFSLTSGAPLSEQQLNIYLDIVMNKKQESYLIPLIINLNKYSSNDVIGALKILINKHPILKGYIDQTNGEPCLKISNNCEIKTCNSIDKIELNKYLTKPFNINSNLSRFIYIKSKRILCASIHHLIFDGLSSLVFKQDLLKILNNEKLKKETAFLLSSAFSSEIKNTKLYHEADLYYEKEFGDIDSIGEFLPDINKNKPSYHKLKLDVDQSKVNEFVKKHSITKNILYSSVFAYTLSRFTNSNDSYFCLIENGRDRLKAENAIGMFVNTLPLIINCANDLVSNFIKNAKERIQSTINYNFYPFRDLKNKYHLSYNIDFQYQPIKTKNKSNREYEFTTHDKNDVISDFSFVINDSYLSISAGFKHSLDTCKRFAYTYRAILKEILVKESLKDIDYTLKEDTNLINEINKTELKLNYADILEAFNASCKKYPNHIMLKYKDVSLTYKESLNYVNSILKLLSNIKKSSNIGLYVERSQFGLLGALAVLAHGSAYVPIDDTYPKERVNFIIKDTKLKVIIVTDKTKTMVKDKGIVLINLSKLKVNYHLNRLLPFNFKQDIPACILYTSGTTGIPKGNLIPRLAFNNVASWYKDATRIKPNSVFAMFYSFCFDVHIAICFASIMKGATISIVPSEERNDMLKFLDYLEKQKVTHLNLPTSFSKVLLTNKLPSRLEMLFSGGEALGKINGNIGFPFFDTYGPTEATVSVTYIEVKDKLDVSSVGHLVKNTKGYVLDKEHRLVPFGAVGELYLSGYQLANGYLNREKENQVSFIKNPYSNQSGYERMYKTGDLVRYLPDNSIAIIGRTDSQVKIRGNRVELGEVEATIREINGVKDVTVQTTLTTNNNKELVAYVVIDNVLTTKEIKEYIAKKKPSYMVPSYIVKLDKIPLNINGKVDKRNLPKVDTTVNKDNYIKPKTKLEISMANIISEVLNISINNIGIETSLVSLGLTSLTSTILSMLYHNKLNVEISPFDLLNNDTIKQQIDIINNKDGRLIHKFNKNGKYNLFFVHPAYEGSLTYSLFANMLDRQISLLAFEQYNFLHSDNQIRGIKLLAKRYVEEIKKYQPHGPYHIGGWSFGGNIAYEMAYILEQENEKVENLFILDSYAYLDRRFNNEEIDKIIKREKRDLRIKKDNIKSLLLSNIDKQEDASKTFKDYLNVFVGVVYDQLTYSPNIKYHGPITYFKAKNNPLWIKFNDKNLENKYNNHDIYYLTCKDCKVIDIPYDHGNYMDENAARIISNYINKIMIKKDKKQHD